MLRDTMRQRRTRRVGFAALVHNNEPVLPEMAEALLTAINYIGPKNVFVSILESGEFNPMIALEPSPPCGVLPAATDEELSM